MSFAYSSVPRPDVAELVSQPLFDEPVLLALPPRLGHERDPIDLKRLAREEWVVGSRQADDRLLAERACANAGYAPNVTHTVDDYDLLLRMVSAGLGVGFVPALALGFSGAKAVTLRTPGGAPLRRHVHVLTRRALAASPLVRALLAELAGADGPSAQNGCASGGRPRADSRARKKSTKKSSASRPASGGRTRPSAPSSGSGRR